MDRKLALVTGASAGIGAAFARIYASHGYDVALSARRKDRLDSLGEELRLRFGVETLSLAADLSDPAAPQRILDDLAAQGRTVDALVNNAGYGVPGGFADNDWATHAAFLQVMVTAPSALARLVVNGMIERRFGRIVNLASLAGLVPGGAGSTLYGAAKAFLIRFSQSLHLEVRESDVHVCALCPGFTYSEFHDVTGTRARVSRSVPPWAWLGADEVAACGYRPPKRTGRSACPAHPTRRSRRWQSCCRKTGDWRSPPRRVVGSATFDRWRTRR